MSKFLKVKYLLIIGILLGSHGYSQNEWNLETCIQMALERNIGLRRQSLQVDLAKDLLQTSQAARLPAFEGFYAHNLSSGKTVNYEDYTYINTQYQDGNIGVQGSLPVFTGLGNWYLSKAARYSFQSEQDKTEELKKALIIDVTSAYLQVLYAYELLAVAESKLSTSLEQLRLNEGFLEAGRISRIEVMNMKAQVAQDQLAKIQAENDIRTARLTLSQLMNLEDAHSFTLKKLTDTDHAVSAIISDAATVSQFAMTNHPGITSLEKLMKSREAGLAASRSRISPTVSLNGIVYSRYSELGVNPLSPTADYPYGEQLRDNMYGRASVNIGIPIFSQFQTRSRINQARIQSMDTRLMLDQKKLAIRQDIQLAHNAALNAQAKFDASEEAVESAQETFLLTQEKYKAGLASGVDFKIAQNQLTQAQLIRIQSKYEFLIRAKVLDLYLNKPITLD